MENASRKIAVDVTETGNVVFYARLLDGEFKKFPDGIWKDWGGFKHEFTVNALQIARFKALEVPVVQVSCKRKKGVGSLKAWWWRGMDNDKVYDIEVKELGRKKVTMLKLASGETYYVDEPADVFRAAIDGGGNDYPEKDPGRRRADQQADEDFCAECQDGLETAMELVAMEGRT